MQLWLSNALYFYLVLQPVPSSLQVHVFRVGVIEAALAQFTVESNHFSIIITNLKTKRTGMSLKQ